MATRSGLSRADRTRRAVRCTAARAVWTKAGTTRRATVTTALVANVDAAVCTAGPVPIAVTLSRARRWRITVGTWISRRIAGPALLASPASEAWSRTGFRKGDAMHGKSGTQDHLAGEREYTPTGTARSQPLGNQRRDTSHGSLPTALLHALPCGHPYPGAPMGHAPAATIAPEMCPPPGAEHRGAARSSPRHGSISCLAHPTGRQRALPSRHTASRSSCPDPRRTGHGPAPIVRTRRRRRLPHCRLPPPPRPPARRGRSRSGVARALGKRSNQEQGTQ